QQTLGGVIEIHPGLGQQRSDFSCEWPASMDHDELRSSQFRSVENGFQQQGIRPCYFEIAPRAGHCVQMHSEAQASAFRRDESEEEILQCLVFVLWRRIPANEVGIDLFGRRAIDLVKTK